MLGAPHPGGGRLARVAAEVAARQPTLDERRAYAATFRSYLAWLGPPPAAQVVTRATLRRYSDALLREGRPPALVLARAHALAALARALPPADAEPAAPTCNLCRRAPAHTSIAPAVHACDPCLARIDAARGQDARSSSAA